VTLVDNWTAATEECLQRLRMDFEDLRDAFLDDDGTAAILRVDATGGDQHHGGRTPVVIVFSSGHRVVYKPRSLSLDQHFAALIGWLNAQGLNPDLRSVRVMDRGTYGWCEFVDHLGCSTDGEVADFYRRQGAYLALFYALGSSDFHRENLIAHGQYPVPVDLETLFCPELGRGADHRAPGLAHRAIAESVLRVGLLPQRVWGSTPWNGIDLSGLSGEAAQQTPFGVLAWSDPNREDDLRLVRRPMPLAPAINRPVLDGEPIAVADHVPLVVEGFEHTYGLLQRLRQSLCADDGPLAAFRSDEIRVVVRPTRTYGALLQETYHPDYLRDAADRDRLLDLLWATVPYAEHLGATVGVEQEDLRAGDVPRFTCQASRTNLWAGPDREVAFQFSKSGLDVAAGRIERLNSDDLARQSWLVKASLATAARDTQQGWARYEIEPVASEAPAVRLRAGELAATIGDRLAGLAYYGEHDVTWIGLTVSGDERWSLCPVRTSLYDGLAGIALFFGYLGTLRGDQKFLQLARRTAASVETSWRVESAAQPQIGAFSGLGGLIYVYTHLAQLLGDEELLTAAQGMVRELPALIPGDREFDIIGGAAGCIAALLALWQHAPADEVMAQAVACGHHLVATATRYPSGCGWVRPEMGPVALAGFAHGAAGIAWALDKLAATTGIDIFASCARSAIEYERTLFFQTVENWRDVRDSGEPKAGEEALAKFSTAWCHGAPGIGLARLAMLRSTPDPAMYRDLEAAVRSTRRAGFGLNHSLCHGDLGNLELLMQAAQLPGFADIAEPFAEAAGGIVGDIDRNGPRCGIPLQVESPGLMTGLAGIGMGLLRIAAGDRVPCVPMLDPSRVS
jgi:type 2 lantibiotic biosynthesis protein LanM